MKTRIINKFRCAQIGNFWICGLAPSHSRMWCHQWPAEKKVFENIAPLVAVAAQEMVNNHDHDHAINFMGKINVPGATVLRGYYEPGSDNRIEIIC